MPSSSPFRMWTGNHGDPGRKVRNRPPKGNGPKSPLTPQPPQPLGHCIPLPHTPTLEPRQRTLITTLLTSRQPPPSRCHRPPPPASSPSSTYPPPPIAPPPPPNEPGKRVVKPPLLPSPHLVSADEEPIGQFACLLRIIRESLVSAVHPQMGTRQWGLIIDLKGHPYGFNDIPAHIAALPYLPLGICHAVAFWGAYAPLKRLMDMATHMVFIQLRGSNQLVAFRSGDIQCYRASTDGDSIEFPQALFTRASLTLQTSTKRFFCGFDFRSSPRFRRLSSEAFCAGHPTQTCPPLHSSHSFT